MSNDDKSKLEEYEQRIGDLQLLAIRLSFERNLAELKLRLEQIGDNQKRTVIKRVGLGAYLMTPVCIIAFVAGWSLADLIL